METDEHSWHILQAFTGDTNMNEFLGLTIDIFYSLLAYARPSIIHSYLLETKNPVPQFNRNPPKEEEEPQGEDKAKTKDEAKEASSSSLPLQAPVKTGPPHISTDLPQQRGQTLTPINEEKPEEESGNEPSDDGDKNILTTATYTDPYIPMTPTPMDDAEAMTMLMDQSPKPQKEENVVHPTSSSSRTISRMFSKKPASAPSPSVRAAEDDKKQYDDNAKKKGKQQEIIIDPTSILSSPSNGKGEMPVAIDKSTYDQCCFERLMRPCRQILSEMIIQYQHITEQKEISMLDTIQELVQSVAQLLDDVDKEESQKTSATQFFYKMMKRFAQDDTARGHVDSLIAALTKIELDPKHKSQIVDAWKELMMSCQKGREKKINQLEDVIVEQSTIEQQQQQKVEISIIHSDIMDNVDT